MTVKKGKKLVPSKALCCLFITSGQHCCGSLLSGGTSCHLCFLPELPVDEGWKYREQTLKHVCPAQ